jgi:hypothetical protein
VTKMLASAIESRVRVTMVSGTMLSVHTTYPLYGWVWSRASKCGTKPVEDQVSVQGKGVLTSRSQRRKGDFTILGRLLSGGCTQDSGKLDGTEATSFCVSRPISRRSVGSLLVGFNSSGSRCTTPVG